VVQQGSFALHNLAFAPEDLKVPTEPSDAAAAGLMLVKGPLAFHAASSKCAIGGLWALYSLPIVTDAKPIGSMAPAMQHIVAAMSTHCGSEDVAEAG
jgi:hypothetical protein